MSELRIYKDNQEKPGAPAMRADISLTEHAAIATRLEEIGVLFERWDTSGEIDDEASQDEVIEVYREQINRLMNQYGFESVDVVSMSPNHPQKNELRDKFLHEHTHSDFEVRFFVDGEGLFYIHANDQVYVVRCVRGDLISVPAQTRHWFDMGDQPSFTAIRLFTTADGWVANYTDDKIAERFPRMEQLAGAA